MITSEEAKKALGDIREVCRQVYDKGLKGEEVVGPLSDIYQRTYEIEGYINSQSPIAPPTTTGA